MLAHPEAKLAHEERFKHTESRFKQDMNPAHGTTCTCNPVQELTCTPHGRAKEGQALLPLTTVDPEVWKRALHADALCSVQRSRGGNNCGNHERRQSIADNMFPSAAEQHIKDTTL